MSVPPLNSLRAFEAAARLSSFAAAADELSLTPAAISHRIKELENRLGIALFLRRHRGVTLTDAGKRYHERLSKIFIQIEQATKELEEQPIDGPLNISAPHSFIRYWLMPRLGGLQALHPGLRISLSAESDLLRFRDGQADVGIRFGAGSYSHIHYEYLMEDAVSVVAPGRAGSGGSHCMAENLLKNKVLLEDSTLLASEPWSQWQTWFKNLGVDLRPSYPRVLFSDSGLVLAACVEGMGICIGRFSLAHQLVLDKKVHAIMPWRRHEFAYYVVSNPARTNDPRVVAFKTWLFEEAKKFQIDSFKKQKI